MNRRLFTKRVSGVAAALGLVGAGKAKANTDSPVRATVELDGLKFVHSTFGGDTVWVRYTINHPDGSSESLYAVSSAMWDDEPQIQGPFNVKQPQPLKPWTKREYKS